MQTKCLSQHLTLASNLQGVTLAAAHVRADLDPSAWPKNLNVGLDHFRLEFASSPRSSDPGARMPESIDRRRRHILALGAVLTGGFAMEWFSPAAG